MICLPGWLGRIGLQNQLTFISYRMSALQSIHASQLGGGCGKATAAPGSLPNEHILPSPNTSPPNSMVCLLLELGYQNGSRYGYSVSSIAGKLDQGVSDDLAGY